MEYLTSLLPLGDYVKILGIFKATGMNDVMRHNDVKLWWWLEPLEWRQCLKPYKYHIWLCYWPRCFTFVT